MIISVCDLVVTTAEHKRYLAIQVILRIPISYGTLEIIFKMKCNIIFFFFCEYFLYYMCLDMFILQTFKSNSLGPRSCQPVCP